MGGVSSDRLRIVMNRVPRTPELTNDEVERMLGVKVYKSIPNDFATLSNAYQDRVLAPQDTKIRRELKRFAYKLAGVEQQKKKRFSLFG